MKITVKKIDITKTECDAIVNPANSYGAMGGGVAGVIKRAGGLIIEKEAIKQAPIPIGSAVATSAGNLPQKAVIHAPTMTNPAEKTNEHNVRNATKAALLCADKNNYKKLAFPGMGTGVGRVPLDIAAKVMVSEIRTFKTENIKEVYLIAIKDDMLAAFNDAIKK